MSEQRSSDAGEAARAPAGDSAPATAREPLEESAEPTEPAEIGQPDFRCPTCGAATTWDPASDALACDYCGARTSVPRADGQVQERALADAGAAARGLGLEQRALRCGECAATVVLDQAATATHCVFCGSASVLPQAANRNVLRPESVIPLGVCRETAAAGFRRWRTGLWFRPGALKRLERFDAIGVYVPYWAFDAAVHSKWSADAGHYYYETRMVPVRVGGRMRLQSQRVRKVRWVPAWGQRDDAYDDYLINASRGLPEPLVAKLGGFDTRALVPYRPEYLAGWRAEEYQLDLENAWQAARSSIQALQEQRCAGDVPGDTHRRLAVHSDIGEVRWKHVLLPVWSLRYEFGGKPYSVLIHGQTGRVVGKAPWSAAKIVLALLAAVAAIALALALAALT
jgi:DNA-directed RNA polymerase subunit RPC12/RpoP